MGKEGVKIEIMDTTLRDGEQTSGVSFVPHEKLMIARLLLEDLKVDRVEVASARVSDGEFEAVKMICDWAARRNLLHKVEVLGFVDGHTSVDWIQRTGDKFTLPEIDGNDDYIEHARDVFGYPTPEDQQNLDEWKKPE